MRNPDLWNGDPASHWIYFDFDDGCRIRVGGRRPDPAALVQRGRFGRSVGAHRADRAEAGLGKANGLLKGETFFWRSGIEYSFAGKAQSVFRDFQFFSDGLGNDCFSALCGLQRRVSSHQRDAARVRSQIHWPKIRVTGKQPNVKRVDAQHLGDDSGENIIGALADLRRAAENTNAAAAIEFELNSRVRHFVPVDRKPGAGQIGGAGQAHTTALRESAEFLFPAGDFDDAANALGKIDGAEPEEICRYGV